jgi:hypothetical protein
MAITDIKVIRLISGEELMGEVLESCEETYKIKNVCQIASSYADPTSATARIGIAPFLPYTKVKAGLTLNKSYVGFIIDPVNELLNEYNKVFGSGIILPPEGTQTIKSTTASAGTSSSNSAFVKL